MSALLNKTVHLHQRFEWGAADEMGMSSGSLVSDAHVPAAAAPQFSLLAGGAAQCVDGKAMETFLKNISHEVRTPLNAILGISEILADTDLDGRQRAYVETMRAAGDDLLRLLNDILDVTRLDAGLYELEVGAFDVAGMIDEVVDQFDAAAACRGLRLRATVDPALPATWMGDGARLRQALAKVVSNAVKFTDAGSVDLWAYPRRDGAELVIDVRDTGPGIPADQLREIFTPFRQIDASTTRATSGSGLGLTVAQQFMRLMNGALEVDSTVGRGSVFRLRVPSFGESSPAFEAEAPVAPRVLVVEDNPVNQLVLQTMLAKSGCDVDVADNGEVAVVKAASQRYDLVLMDCQMPVKDGYEATAAIRNLGHPYRAVPIVAVTASATPEDRLRCLDVGMDDYIAKPVSKDAVATLLARFAPRL